VSPRRSAPPGPGDTFAQEGAALVLERCERPPEVAVVLGSGLGDAVAGDVRADGEIAFDALPGFPPAGVPGHAGRIVLGELYGTPAMVFLGRIHLYEDHGMATVTLPVRLMAAAGVRTLVLTNAAGGLDPSMPLGLLLLIRDHINWMGENPLRAWRYPDGTPAFVDVSGVWDPTLREAARAAAEDAGVEVREGVYAAVAGPSYETAAETTMLAGLGADAVGMSTVPEAVAAAALGIRCLGISCITDVAGTELTHEDVVAVAGAAAPSLRAILAGAIPRIAQTKGTERSDGQ
jgi:purine-nucleoside phosphorylase